MLEPSQQHLNQNRFDPVKTFLAKKVRVTDLKQYLLFDKEEEINLFFKIIIAAENGLLAQLMMSF